MLLMNTEWDEVNFYSTVKWKNRLATRFMIIHILIHIDVIFTSMWYIDVNIHIHVICYVKIYTFMDLFLSSFCQYPCNRITDCGFYSSVTSRWLEVWMNMYFCNERKHKDVK